MNRKDIVAGMHCILYYPETPYDKAIVRLTNRDDGYVDLSKNTWFVIVKHLIPGTAWAIGRDYYGFISALTPCDEPVDILKEML